MTVNPMELVGRYFVRESEVNSMDREQINKIYSDYLNDCESEHDMEQIFDLALQAQADNEQKIHHLTDEAYSELCLFAAKGREALHTLEQIKQITNAPVYVQEDVMRYKMICEVIRDDKA